MDRVILFRGKNIKTRQWEFGEYVVPNLLIQSDPFDAKAYVEVHKITVSCVQVDVTTVGQFTGLFDVHNRAVYEGDIVTDDGLGKKKFEVVYSKVFCGWQLKELSLNPDKYINLGGASLEVVGNIYDN